MATSKVAAVIDALLVVFEAAVDSDAVHVSDGPFVDNFNHPAEVFVGHDGSDDTEGEAARSEQEDVGLGMNNRRDETVTVTCAVLCWQMENQTQLPRARAYVILDQLEAAIMADRSLGFPAAGAEGGARNALVGDTSLHTFNNAGGAGARVVFTVAVTCRL